MSCWSSKSLKPQPVSIGPSMRGSLILVRMPEGLASPLALRMTLPSTMSGNCAVTKSSGLALRICCVGVVNQPLVGALLVQVMVVPARYRARVVGPRVDDCRPGQVVLAVVELPDHDGAVDVAINEVHHDFGAHAGSEDRPPIGACDGLEYAHPRAAAVVARGMAGIGAARCGGRTQAASQRGLAALPRSRSGVCRIRVASWVMRVAQKALPATVPYRLCSVTRKWAAQRTLLAVYLWFDGVGAQRCTH
jgi:hypothetical protein